MSENIKNIYTTEYNPQRGAWQEVTGKILHSDSTTNTIIARGNVAVEPLQSQNESSINLTKTKIISDKIHYGRFITNSGDAASIGKKILNLGTSTGITNNSFAFGESIKIGGPGNFEIGYNIDLSDAKNTGNLSFGDNIYGVGQNNIYIGKNINQRSTKDSITFAKDSQIDNSQDNFVLINNSTINASKQNSIVGDLLNIFSGENNLLFGKNTTVSHSKDSIILGRENVITQSENISLVGNENTIGSGCNNTLIFGDNNSFGTSNGFAITFGQGNSISASEQAEVFGASNQIVSSLNSSAFGENNSLRDSERSAAYGNSNNIRSGIDSEIFGLNNVISSEVNSTLFGKNNFQSSGENNLVLSINGKSNNSFGITTVGQNNTLENSEGVSVFGTNNSVKYTKDSILLGLNNITAPFSSVSNIQVLGNNNLVGATLYPLPLISSKDYYNIDNFATGVLIAIITGDEVNARYSEVYGISNNPTSIRNYFKNQFTGYNEGIYYEANSDQLDNVLGSLLSSSSYINDYGDPILYIFANTKVQLADTATGSYPSTITFNGDYYSFWTGWKAYRNDSETDIGASTYPAGSVLIKATASPNTSGTIGLTWDVKVPDPITENPAWGTGVVSRGTSNQSGFAWEVNWPAGDSVLPGGNWNTSIGERNEAKAIAITNHSLYLQVIANTGLMRPLQNPEDTFVQGSNNRTFGNSNNVIGKGNVVSGNNNYIIGNSNLIRYNQNNITLIGRNLELGEGEASSSVIVGDEINSIAFENSGINIKGINNIKFNDTKLVTELDLTGYLDSRNVYKVGFTPATTYNQVENSVQETAENGWFPGDWKTNLENKWMSATNNIVNPDYSKYPNKIGFIIAGSSDSSFGEMPYTEENNDVFRIMRGIGNPFGAQEYGYDDTDYGPFWDYDPSYNSQPKIITLAKDTYPTTNFGTANKYWTQLNAPGMDSAYPSENIVRYTGYLRVKTYNINNYYPYLEGEIINKIALIYGHPKFLNSAVAKDLPPPSGVGWYLINAEAETISDYNSSSPSSTFNPTSGPTGRHGILKPDGVINDRFLVSGSIFAYNPYQSSYAMNSYSLNAVPASNYNTILPLSGWRINGINRITNVLTGSATLVNSASNPWQAIVNFSSGNKDIIVPGLVELVKVSDLDEYNGVKYGYRFFNTATGNLKVKIEWNCVPSFPFMGVGDNPWNPSSNCYWNQRNSWGNLTDYKFRKYHKNIFEALTSGSLAGNYKDSDTPVLDVGYIGHNAHANINPSGREFIMRINLNAYDDQADYRRIDDSYNYKYFLVKFLKYNVITGKFSTQYFPQMAEDPITEAIITDENGDIVFLPPALNYAGNTTGAYQLIRAEITGEFDNLKPVPNETNWGSGILNARWIAPLNNPYVAGIDSTLPYFGKQLNLSTINRMYSDTSISGEIGAPTDYYNKIYQKNFFEGAGTGHLAYGQGSSKIFIPVIIPN